MSGKVLNVHLVAKQFRVVLGVEVRLSGLRRVELETLANTFTKNVEGGVGLHDLGHGLLNERLHTGRPVSVGGMKVVSEVETDQDSGTGQDAMCQPGFRQAIESKLTGRGKWTCCRRCNRGTKKGPN